MSATYVTISRAVVAISKSDDAVREAAKRHSKENVLTAIENRVWSRCEDIGDVRENHPGMILLRTVIGGTRILRKPPGEPIPRVC